jgi:hypothetical protein
MRNTDEGKRSWWIGDGANMIVAFLEALVLSYLSAFNAAASPDDFLISNRNLFHVRVVKTIRSRPFVFTRLS